MVIGVHLVQQHVILTVDQRHVINRLEAASVSNCLLILKSVLVNIGVHPAISNAKYTLRNRQAIINFSGCIGNLIFIMLYDVFIS